MPDAPVLPRTCAPDTDSPRAIAPLFASLSPEAVQLLNARVRKKITEARRDDQKRIHELESALHQYQHRFHGRDGRLVIGEKMQRPPRLLLERLRLPEEPTREVLCAHCLERHFPVHLFLLYGALGFAFQSFGRDKRGLARHSWSIVTSRLCCCGYVTQIVGDGLTECWGVEP